MRTVGRRRVSGTTEEAQTTSSPGLWGAAGGGPRWLHLEFFSVSATRHVGTFVPLPGVKPMPPASEAWSLNHWTTREFPRNFLFKKHSCGSPSARCCPGQGVGDGGPEAMPLPSGRWLLGKREPLGVLMAHRTPAFHRVYFPALRNWPSMAQVHFCQHGPPGPPQLFTPHSSVPEPQLGLSP